MANTDRHPVSDDDFIETQIQFQLGSFGYQDFSMPLDALYQATTFPSPIFGVFDAHLNQVLGINDCDQLVTAAKEVWNVNPAKTSVNKKARIAGFLNAIRLYSAKKCYAFDFWDGRPDHILSTWYAGEAFPVFQYNRISQNRNAILWPLHNYHTIDNPYFLERQFSDPTRFEDKEAKICWRGIPTGGGFDEIRQTDVGIQSILANFALGRINTDILCEQLLLIPRYRFVSAFAAHELFDVGFSISNPAQQYMADYAPLAAYLKPPLSKLAHCRFKYLLALSGWDVATSFYWMLSTNSLVFKEDYPYEAFADCHFQAWVHYIPISPDFDDIIAKYEWCEANPQDCQAIVANAQAVCQKLLSRDLRKKILGAVVSRYEHRLQI